MAVNLAELIVPGLFGLGSAKLQSDAINKSAQAQQASVDLARQLAMTPTYDVFGNVQEFGKAPQLTPDTQRLVNALQQGQTQVAETTPALSQVTQELINQFRGIDRNQLRSSNAADFTADRNFVMNSVINPAVSDAMKIDARLNQGSTNPNRTLEAVSKGAAPTLASIGKVAETDKYGSRLDDEIKRTLGLASGSHQLALSGATGQTLPFQPMTAATNTGAANAVSNASSNLPGPNLALAQGLSGLGATVQAAGQSAAARDDRNRLYDIFERTLGNQKQVGSP